MPVYVSLYCNMQSNLYITATQGANRKWLLWTGVRYGQVTFIWRSLNIQRDIFLYKEGNVLFNDALNTFYFTLIWRRTYGKGPLG